jgi:potassium-dependent mechanosensitive channel
MNRSILGVFQCPYLALSLFFLAFLLFVPPVVAQPTAELDSALVEKRLEELRKAGNADDSEIVQAYEEIRHLLIQTESNHREAAKYMEAMTIAPQREAEIQDRIDAIDDIAETSENFDSLVEEELEARLIVARAELSEINMSLASVDQHLARRETDADTIRSRLAEIKIRLDALPQPDISVDTTIQASLAEARDWRRSAERSAMTSERRALEARLSSQPLRHRTLAVERAELAQNAERLTRQVHELEIHLKGRMTETLDAESMGIEADDPAYTLATQLLEYDKELRAESIDVNEDLALVRRQVEEIESQSRELADNFATARRMVDFAAGSKELGGVLLAYGRANAQYRLVSPTNFSREVGGTVIKRIEMEAILKQLSSSKSYISMQLEKDGVTADQIPKDSLATLLDLAKAYRARLRNMVGLQSNYIEALTSLRDNYVALTTLHKKYDNYLRGLILWIPSYPPLWDINIESVHAELDALRAMLGAIHFSLSAGLLPGLAVFALLFFQRYRLISYQRELNSRIARARSDSIYYTLLALACVVLRALPLPILFWVLGSALSPERVGMIFSNLAFALFGLQSIRILCEPSGVALLHFNWATALTEQLRQELGEFIRWWLPLAVVFYLVIRANITIAEAVTARFAIIGVLVVPLILIAASFYKNIQGAISNWIRDLPNQFRLLLMLVLGSLSVAVIIGHVYSVKIVFDGVVTTLWVAISLLIAHSVLMRWVKVTRRRLRMAQLLKARAAQLDKEEGLIEEKLTNLSVLSAQSRQLINVGVGAAAAIAIIYIWSPLLPAIDVFSKVTLWTSTMVRDGEEVENIITLKTLLIVVFLAGLTIYGARKLPALIDLLLRSRTTVSASTRYTVSALLNYVIIAGGAIVGLSSLGVQWAQLQWLVAAMGVGIGFGLQEIIANFISGLIILFERPIRVGDVISTGGQDGIVTRIRIRATTICDWDGKELLVPNKEFVTGRLLNWSLSDPKIRIVLPVGIAYGSNVELALKTMHELVCQHPRVVDEPAPQIVFEGFGDNALLLSARCFLKSYENRMGVVTDLNREINKQFEQAGIVIAFPQRDIHFDTAKPLRIALEEAPGSSSKKSGDR